MKLKQYCRRGLVFLIFSIAVFQAQASSVVYEDFAYVSGNTAKSTQFEVATPGLYKADLVDFEFPEPFDVLALGITQNNVPLGIGFGSGSFTFNVSAPGTLFAHLAAVPGMAGEGLYGLQIVPIPLPSAIWLLLSGVAGIVTLSRFNRTPSAA